MNDLAAQKSSFAYLAGFGNELVSEALPGALPMLGNSPQKAPLGLYAEQLSGSAFTVPRAQNLRSWQYRLYPSAQHGPYRRIGNGLPQMRLLWRQFGE